MRLALVSLVLLTAAAQAQPARLEATVRDAESGAVLPGATAQVAGAEGGASADADGRLTLDLPSLPDTVVVRFVGYAVAQIVVRPDEAVGGVVRRDLRLSAAPYVLGEVTVTGEPPGEVLWRRLLARRQRLAARLGAYAAEGYSRLLLTRDGPTDVRPRAIGLTETVSNLSWTRGAGMKEEVIARQRRPFGGPFRWASMEPVPDLYFEDVLMLDGRAIPSPTRYDALENYAFRLGETVEMDGVRYLDLAVIPRRAGLLIGRIRVVDTLLVVAEAELRADFPATGVVDAFDATYTWTYGPEWSSAALRDSVWFPRRFEREGRVTVSFPGNRVPTVAFRQLSLVDLIRPGVRGEAAYLRRRFRNPRGAYAGVEIFRSGRARAPLDSLEIVAAESEWVEQSTLAELLKPQEGIGISFGIFGGAISRGLGIDVEGEDDD